MKAATLPDRPDFSLMKLNDVISYYHLQMPRWLFADSRYKLLALESKVAYTFLLNRFQLSRMNGWINDAGEVFIIFTRQEASATGVLSATTDGTDLDRTSGKYKDLIVVGFDSGSTLNNAVRNEYFYGAVAQDPYTMGYEALMMAINVLQGGEASDIVIPAVWFDASNMDDPDVARILYD